MFDWLIDVNCRNYFIIECNLFSHKMNEANFDCILDILYRYSHLKHLIKWFNEHYFAEYDNIQREMSTAEYASNFCEYKQSEYKFIRIHRFMEVMHLRSMVFAFNAKHFNDTYGNVFPRGFCMSHIGLIEDGTFVDFYKGHVILQVVSFNRTHKEHDNLLAMMSTLFINYQRYFEEISVFQIIDRKLFYVMAVFVLGGCTTNYETDHFLKMKLATILIKEELQLYGGNLNESPNYCVDRELVHLAALHFAAKRYTSSKKYVELARGWLKFKPTDSRTWISANSLVFLDEMAFVMGLLSLVRVHTIGIQGELSNKHAMQTSVKYFSGWIYCLCQIKINDPVHNDIVSFSNSVPMCEPTTSTDVCLHILLNHFKQNANRKIEKQKYIVYERCSSNPARRDERDAIPISEEDNFSDLMTICAVIHLTRFYQSLRNDFPYLKCTKAVSHYKALYWFRQGQYYLVLKLCEDILEEENVNHPEYSDFVENTDPLIEYRTLPSLFFPFLELYDSDVVCLFGLTYLINILFYCHPMYCKAERTMSRDQIYALPLISPGFIARYLKIRCAMKCKRSKTDLLGTLIQLHSGKLFLEQVLTMFTTIRMHRTICPRYM